MIIAPSPLASRPALRPLATAEGGGTGRLGTRPAGLGCEPGTAQAPARPAGGASSVWVNGYTVQPLDMAAAVQLNQVLAPVLHIVRAEPRPIVFREDTGLFVGWSAGSRTTNPEGRITLSEELLRGRKCRLIAVYLHELAHCLLDQAEQIIEDKETFVHDHDAAFLGLQTVMFLRLELADLRTDTATSWFNKTRFYDLQDPPPCWADESVSKWLPRALSWALENAEELAASDLDALGVAEEICRRYWVWADSMAAEPAQRADTADRSRIAEAQRQQAVRSLRADLQLFRWLTAFSTFAFLSSAWLWVTR
ncbi:hypothetical protein [Hydrogenophaga sp. 2FB]|uniref:hypothetical protein n=1 Tax=Hydrogenophaga sp. 2FB TaxID=2502187 RepID=UPI0010F8BE96|nr:hypothetical protein [Hydrogenophaga sp. 2FB]